MFTIARRASSRFYLLCAATVFCAFTYTANAQTKEFSLDEINQAAGTPYALLQYSTLTGTGNTITAVLVPVVTSTGATIYENVTLQFDVSAAGVLSVGSITSVPAPPPIVSGFKAGAYVGPSTIYSGDMLINVSGPSQASGGANMWSLAAASGGSSCTYPDTATWYVGSISTSPWAARIKAAGITSTAFSYGVGVSNNNCPWYENSLLGFSQVGNTLTIVSFTNGSGDHADSVYSVTYTPYTPK
jgi:hypothetical protein